MKRFASHLFTASVLALSVSTAYANDDHEPKVDPSDLTAVSTSGYIGMNNQGDVKLSASLGFGLDNGQMAMGTLEGTMDQEGKYKDSRLQYFHVFNLPYPHVPRVAASLDLIDNANFTTLAVGAVAMFNPGIKDVVMFGRVGALAGQYDENFSRMMGENDSDIIGGMAAGYLSWKPGADGTYLMFSPEYTYMDGSIETSTLKTSLTLGTPLSADGKRWGQFKLENTYGQMESSQKTIHIDDTVAWAFYKVYF
ncbi:hypothetical protein [Vibrio vulnificus YJ016]|uniref:Outer membrane protein beta-barrel domain-containing protein n=1 Tax=Vibrio vulnificus (strain YJ016) TaxID=196600 RepID=Q7MD64_VIBVY|nr:hypothetical protein [Vibrio vulnificus]EHT4939862.1 hypothetical protein [Vibrio vulnificus]EHT4943870.1 hypothetical protein [Vibrio vulnificus]EHY1013192.1 hypothetical protein [Vibrio vulnificus]EHY1120770.1 hypothetical protein [Vibrio vulnificus]EJT0551614.1 hypothetical protein [Vibrio vulnificus]